jgi:hypothetical protein
MDLHKYIPIPSNCPEKTLRQFGGGARRESPMDLLNIA